MNAPKIYEHTLKMPYIIFISNGRVYNGDTNLNVLNIFSICVPENSIYFTGPDLEENYNFVKIDSDTPKKKRFTHINIYLKDNIKH